MRNGEYMYNGIPFMTQNPSNGIRQIESVKWNPSNGIRQMTHLTRDDWMQLDVIADQQIYPPIYRGKRANK